MPLFVLMFRYVEDAALVSEHRPEHREYLQTFLERGELLAAGPLGEPGPAGGLLLLQVESADRVEEILKGDPFYTQGVITEHMVQEWTLAFGSELFSSAQSQ